MRAVRVGALIDGTEAEPRNDTVILLDGPTITGVGGTVPRDADLVDCSALTVMPGLIDCHVHLWETPSTMQERLHKPYSLRVAEAFRNARVTLEPGSRPSATPAGHPAASSRRSSGA